MCYFENEQRFSILRELITQRHRQRHGVQKDGMMYLIPGYTQWKESMVISHIGCNGAGLYLDFARLQPDTGDHYVCVKLTASLQLVKIALTCYCKCRPYGSLWCSAIISIERHDKSGMLIYRNPTFCFVKSDTYNSGGKAHSYSQKVRLE